MEKLKKIGRRVAGGADARAVRGAAPEGHRARLHRRLLGRQGRRHLPLRGLRPGAVQLRHQVRLRHRLAELLGPDGRRERRDPARQQPLHAPHRGRLRALRRPPGPRLRRRPEPDRPALLHQLLLAGPWTRRTRASSGAAAARRLPPIRRRSRVAERARQGDRAVGALAVLEQRDQRAADGDRGAVQRVDVQRAGPRAPGRKRQPRRRAW